MEILAINELREFKYEPVVILSKPPGRIYYEWIWSHKTLTRAILIYPKKSYTWNSENKQSSCSAEKSQANFASKSCTFFTIASCFPIWAIHIVFKSFNVNVFVFIVNLIIFSSFSTYWGWWRLSLSTITKTWFSCSHLATMSWVNSSSSSNPECLWWLKYETLPITRLISLSAFILPLNGETCNNLKWFMKKLRSPPSLHESR